ncbi:MAG: hypothetical protein M1832_006403 [Thelocarpon impressellum]|nr:MAG: hypothetical protein M1832_006403 [Thelocarpon impressellum]
MRDEKPGSSVQLVPQAHSRVQLDHGADGEAGTLRILPICGVEGSVAAFYHAGQKGEGEVVRGGEARLGRSLDSGAGAEASVETPAAKFGTGERPATRGLALVQRSPVVSWTCMRWVSRRTRAQAQAPSAEGTRSDPRSRTTSVSFPWLTWLQNSSKTSSWNKVSHGTICFDASSLRDSLRDAPDAGLSTSTSKWMPDRRSVLWCPSALVDGVLPFGRPLKACDDFYLS